MQYLKYQTEYDRWEHIPKYHFPFITNEGHTWYEDKRIHEYPRISTEVTGSEAIASVKPLASEEVLYWVTEKSEIEWAECRYEGLEEDDSESKRAFHRELRITS